MILYDDLHSSYEECNAIIAPPSHEMEKIVKLNQDIHDIKTRLHAMGMVIKATAQPHMSGDIYIDDKITHFSLKENKSNSWTATQSLKIKIDEIGEIEVLSGSQDVKEMNEKLEEMHSKYKDLVAPFGTDDLTDLNKLIIKKESVLNEITRIKNDLNKKSDKSKNELKREILELKNKIKSNWERIPSESVYNECEGKEKLLVRNKLSRKIKQLQSKIESLSQDRNELNEEIETDRKRVKGLNDRINEFKRDSYGKIQRAEEIQKRLKKLENDNLTSGEREAKLNQLSFNQEQKTRAWNIYNEEIEEKEKQPLGDFEGLNNKVEILKQDITNQKIKNAEMKRELQVLITQYKDSTLIEEKLTQLQLKEKEFETEADAIKILFELTSFYKENTIGELTEPIRKRVTEDLEKLLGPKYSLNFNKQMKPESINVKGEDASINLLSFGTQEQVWCLFRLALGYILSSKERQMVVLDDPLVNTDPARMHHALKILEENAMKMQIIVLTCDMNKYNSLNNANFISMV